MSTKQNTTLGEYPLIMGIVNITPDSFFDGGNYNDIDNALRRISDLVNLGADIIDIGGESSRPGAKPVSLQEEMDRVCPVVERAVLEFDTFISVDTYKAGLADEVLNTGASMINDISAFSLDSTMPQVIAKHNAWIVLMHMKGTPDVMQYQTDYDSIIHDIYNFLENKTNIAKNAGIDKNKIIIDPGIGFGKSLEDNYALLHNIPVFRNLGYPVLVGLSRKSLISNLYIGNEDSLPASLALNSIALYNGADIIRVHDVHEHYLAIQAVKMFRKVVQTDG